MEKARVHLLSVLHTGQQLVRAHPAICVALIEPFVTLFSGLIRSERGFPARVGMYMCDAKISLEWYRDYDPALLTSQEFCEHLMK